jgi:hypothetical protein
MRKTGETNYNYFLQLTVPLGERKGTLTAHFSCRNELICIFAEICFSEMEFRRTAWNK